MATTAETSSHHSPRGTGFAGDGPNSPLNHRRGPLSSPWAQVVRGEPGSTPAGSRSPPSPAITPEQTDFRDCSAKSRPSSPSPPPDNAAAELCNGREKSKAARSKPAWNKPSNGVMEAAVMGAASWPPLSESTRAAPKSSADSSTKNTDGSAPIIQPVIPLSSKQEASSIPTSTPNHVLPVQQRYMKHDGGSTHTEGGDSRSGFTQLPPPPPPFPIFQLSPNNYGTLISPFPNSSLREPPYRGNTWETRPVVGFVPQPRVNDHQSNSQRGNYGPRGNGSHHNNFGSRRDQMPPQRGSPRGVIRGPPPAPHNTAPFIAPQNVRPFQTPIGFADATPQLSYYPQLPFKGMPFIVPQPPPFYIPPPDKSMPVRLLDQIEFYFSDANLIKDDFLKSKMDDQGWVSVTLIAGFPRVKGLTNNVQLILDSLRTSTVVEVQGEKLRRRNEWMKWIPNSGHLPTESGSSSSGAANCNMLVTSFSKVKVDEMKSEQGDICHDAAAAETSARQEQLSNGGDWR